MTTENMKLSRRGFLGLGAAATAAAAAAGLAGCAPKTKAETARPSLRATRGRPRPSPSPKWDATEETDVVVIGGGIAGFSAACSAAEKGAKVVLLEKTGAGQFRGIDYGAIAASCSWRPASICATASRMCCRRCCAGVIIGATTGW